MLPDPTLAAPELAAVQVHGTTRADFLLRGALAAGAVCGVSAVAPFVGQAFASGAKNGGRDTDILNFALLLEYLEAEFYRRAQRLRLSHEVRQAAQKLGDHEAQHTAFLTKTIRQRGAVPRPTSPFAFDMRDEASFLKLAQKLEDTGVGAYNGAGPRLKSKELLAAAGTIAQVEGRHAAEIRNLQGLPFAPSSFDQGLGIPDVVTRVTPYVKNSSP